MKQAFLSMMIAAAALGATAADFTRTATGVTTRCGDVNIAVDFYTDATARIVKMRPGYAPDSSLAVIAEPKAVKLKYTVDGAVATLASKALQVKVDASTGTVAFYTPEGTLLTDETTAATFSPYDDAGRPSWVVSQSFSVEPTEAVYGLGILQNDKMSQRGQDITLVQGNTDNVTTFYQSVKGYGIFWDNYSPTHFTDNGTSLTWKSEVAAGVDYYFMYGSTADGVIAQVRALTGHVPMLPLWSYGYMQCRERYVSQDQVREVADWYRANDIPIDCIIQDWQYWDHNYLWNAMDFLNRNFPDPRRMTDELHAKNIHMLISVWPSFGPQTKPYRQLSETGHLYPFRTFPTNGTNRPAEDYPSGVLVYDAFSPEARDIYWQNLERLYDLGIDGWWLDSTEPDQYGSDREVRTAMTHLGTFQRMRNAYPLVSVEGVYDHQRQRSDSTRVTILTRCAFTGQQRTGANTWSGDVVSTWESLRKQVKAGLNFTLVGNPNYNSDIGGFYCGAYNRHGGDAPRYADYQELYTRWLQANLFCPMMRSHGTNAPREIYQFGKKGEPVFDAIASTIRLRYNLIPYIYATAREVTANDGSYMRPLVMDFAADERTHDLGTQFMFGRQLMAAPILENQYTTKGDKTADFTATRQSTIYLPEGTDWWDFHNGNKYSGGQDIVLETTLADVPIFARAGAIVPIGPANVMYTSERPWDNLTIRVFPGADGSFTLYEDEFDNYNYEKGAYTEIPMKWNDRKRTLTIEARQGSYPGMLTERRFLVALPDGTFRTVNYRGKKVTVKM